MGIEKDTIKQTAVSFALQVDALLLSSCLELEKPHPDLQKVRKELKEAKLKMLGVANFITSN